MTRAQHTQRYQGIVELNGTSLEEVAQTYFRQSEQIPTHVRLAVSEYFTPIGQGEGSIAPIGGAGGVLVQFLPESPDRITLRDFPGGDAPDGTSDIGNSKNVMNCGLRPMALVSTVSDDELTDPEIGVEILLFRLFP